MDLAGVVSYEYVVGYDSDGHVVGALEPVADAVYNGGLAYTAYAAVFVTTTTDASDVYVQGVRVTVEGAVVIEDAVPVRFVNGNPVTATGALAVDLQ
jgi:hypothetical protein